MTSNGKFSLLARLEYAMYLARACETIARLFA